MVDEPQHDGRRRVLAAPAVVLALVVALVLAVTGAAVLVIGLRAPTAGPAAPERSQRVSADAVPGDTSPEPAPAADAAAAAPAEGGPAAPAVPAVQLGPILPASPPVAVSIPSIGVAADVLVPLALDAQGVLPAPADHALPGWYTGGPNPGQLGPAVIAGHVDGPGGPAVFYRLGELVPGATVDVTRADGVVATFVVDTVERYAKSEFPTSRVYGNTTDRAEIRLITCGGAFDRTTGHYVDNVVVFGHLVA